MGNMLIKLMDTIEASCHADGYYPDLVELDAMAQAALQSTDKSIQEIITEYNA